LKILLITEYFPPDQVGAATRVNVLAHSLKRKHQVCILTSSPHYPGRKSKVRWYHPVCVVTNQGIKIVRVWMPTFDVTSFFGRVVNYLYFSFFSILWFPLIGRNDLVWGTSPNVFTFIPTKIYSKLFKVPSILNIDDLWPTAPIELGFINNKSMQNISIKFALASMYVVNGISTISESLTRLVRILQPLIPVDTVYVGISNDRLNQLKLINNLVKENDSDKIVFLYSGILGPAYDFEILIDGFCKFSELHENVELIIRGNGPEMKSIFTKLKSVNCPKIKLLVDYLTENELNHLLMSCHVMILPLKDNLISRTAIPTKLIEYMATQKFILHIGKGQARSIVNRYGNGISTGYKIDEIVNAMKIAYLNTPKNFNSDFIELNFSEDIVLKQAEELIKKVMQNYMN